MTRSLRLRILDRYVISELSGPFFVGLLAFTSLLAANEILNIGKLITNDHAPLWAAIEIFLWSLPSTTVLVIPMAMLLGTLLMLQRLSGESEIIAMKAGGIALVRIVLPILACGLAMSFVTLAMQEWVQPFAQDQSTEIENTVIKHVSAFNRDLTVTAPLPGGGRQISVATGYDTTSQALLNVTLIQYDKANAPTLVAFANKADFEANQWNLTDVSTYRFNTDGTVTQQPHTPSLVVALGQTPSGIMQRIKHDDPEQMSRSQIAQIIASGQLTENQIRKYVMTYQEKLARPFACFVFALLAVPFGMRQTRGGGNASLGFGLAIGIVFIYYVVATICSYFGEALLPTAMFWAWVPNLLFSFFGLQRVRMAAMT